MCINQILEFLKENPSIIIAFLTFIYVFLTFLILRQMRKEREELRRPYILIRDYLHLDLIER